MEKAAHNQEMNLAWQFIANTNMSVFLTGKAGTGKTTFLRRLRELTPKRMVVLAPTGVAAINAQGQTIHSFFQISPGPNIPGQQTKESSHYSMSKHKKQLIRSLDLLVIDEISMVRCDLLDAIDREMRLHKNRTKPFGGVQLLLIGDLQQLSPVAHDSEWAMLQPYYDTSYFYGSNALRQIQYVTIELKHIYRQQDSTFIDILAHIRNNTITHDVLRKLNARYIQDFQPPKDQHWIRLTTHNNMANSHNSIELEQLKGLPQKFEAIVQNNFPEYSYPTEKTLWLKVGAQVMFVKNDPSGSHQYYNGKIGIVQDIDNDLIYVRCEGDTEDIEVPRLTWENIKYVIDEETKEIKETVDGTFTQYPLRLAWAITVHKSQGLTFDHAVLDINQSFAHGQAYVALSRCRTLEGLVLANPLNNRAIITDSSVNSYIDKELEETQTTAKQLPQIQRDYFLMLLDELFDFNPLLWNFNALLRVVDEHLYNAYPQFLANLKEAKTELEAHIVSVALKFRTQYQQLIEHSPNIYKDDTLQERIKAGSNYFADKLTETFSHILEQKALSIDNKQTSKQYNNALDIFMQSLGMKASTLTHASAEGFTVKSYLSNKAKAAIEDIKLPTKRSKAKKANPEKPEKPKRQKGDSERESLRLYQEGNSIKEIAELRNMKPQTIETHLTSFIASGILDVNDFVSTQHQKFIRGTINSFDRSYTLSDIKALVPPNYTYLEIKAVIADMNREAQMN